MIVAPDQYQTLPTNLVLCGGAFDPLHTGHLDYLAKASQFGPVCVAVASDARIWQCKGRPALLPQATRMAILSELDHVSYVVAQDDSGEAGALEDIRPKLYVKGKEWVDALPPAELRACSQFGIPAMFIETQRDSSSERLKAQDQKRDILAVAEFEHFLHNQQEAAPWTPVTDYSFEGRKLAEGQHPQLIKDVFKPRNVWDIGCGFGYLVQMLRDIDVPAEGMDAYPPAGAVIKMLGGSILEDRLAGIFDGVQADLVICREVLEHLTVKQIRQAVRNLVRLSSKYIYVTTRFHPSPSHLLDVTTDFETDPTHITCLSKDFLRALFVLEGCRSRPDLEDRMDWQKKGRCLVFEV